MNHSSRVFIIFLVFLTSVAIFLFSMRTAIAALTLTISDAPSNLDVNEEFEVFVDLKEAPKNTIYYFRVAFTAQGTTAYFSYTQKNDGSWHKYEESFENFYQITTNEEGSWSGKIKGKSDGEDKDFKGSGEYLLRVGRFTSSGKSHYWSDNSLTVNIQAPTPTPTSTPSPTNTLTPTPIPKPTSTSTPQPTHTSTPTPRSPMPTSTITPTSSPTGEILTAEATSVFEKSSPTPEILGEAFSSHSSLLPKILIGAGAFLLFLSGGFLFFPKIKQSLLLRKKRI